MENKQLRALKAAFPNTIPVLTGFIFLGIAYGVLMTTKGFAWQWTFVMSTFVFAGSMQYVAIPLLASAFNPIQALLLTLMINARHLFYGIGMFKRFKGAGTLKPYMIFTLCDETFSLLCITKPPQGVDEHWFMFFIALLNQFYWVAGSVIGALVGQMVTFNTEGLDFVLTALFVVLFLNQWKSQSNHKPALLGLGLSVICLLIFGPSNFIIPSMILILVVLSLGKNKILGGTGK